MSKVSQVYIKWGVLPIKTLVLCRVALFVVRMYFASWNRVMACLLANKNVGLVQTPESLTSDILTMFVWLNIVLLEPWSAFASGGTLYTARFWTLSCLNIEPWSVAVTSWITESVCHRCSLVEHGDLLMAASMALCKRNFHTLSPICETVQN